MFSLSSSKRFPWLELRRRDWSDDEREIEIVERFFRIHKGGVAGGVGSMDIKVDEGGVKGLSLGLRLSLDVGDPDPGMCCSASSWSGTIVSR